MGSLSLPFLVVVTVGSSLVAQQWHCLPPPRLLSGLPIAYDSARSKTVMLQGMAFPASTDLADTWEHDGTTWTQVFTPHAPEARFQYQVAFDSTRSRCVLLGWDDLGLADTWEYDGRDWTRTVHGMAMPRGVIAFDSGRGRTVLRGFDYSVLATTWEYDGTSWTQINTTTPPASYPAATLAYDSLRGRIVLQSLGIWGSVETWEYDGVNWTQIAVPASPSIIGDKGAVFDSVRSRTVVVVHQQLQGAMTETWEYDGVNWQRITTSVTPPAFDGSSLVYDSTRARVVIYCSQSKWEFDGTNWTQTTTGTFPAGRSGHAIAYDSGRDRMVLFGGIGYGGVLADMWELNGVTWSPVTTPAGPSSRYSHTLTYDSRRQRVVLFGGAQVGPPLNDTWEFDGTTWAQIATAIAPQSRLWHATSYDDARGVMVLFGGSNPLNLQAPIFNDTWEYDGSNWMLRVTPNSPPARAGHACAYDSRLDRTVLFGGRKLGGISNDTWLYDGANWTSALPAHSPSSRHMHALTYDSARGRVIMFGGATSTMSAFEGFADTWEFDGQDWAELTTTFGPMGRYETAMAYDSARGRAVLFGGSAFSYADTWGLLPPTTPTWTRLGVGCAGSAGTPDLDVAAGVLPHLGSTVPLHLSSLPATPSLLFLTFGLGIAAWNGAALPLDLSTSGLPGCKLWIEPSDVVVLPAFGSTSMARLHIPSNPAFAGLLVATQAFVFDPAAPSGLGAVTNAGVMRLY